MTTRLTLLAHGETVATRRAAFALDEGLDERGRAALAGLPALRCDRALTSGAPAARQTAAALGLAAADDPGLRDLAMGAWAGHAFTDIAEADPAGAAAFVADPAFAGHGGESIIALVARVEAWLAVQGKVRGRLVAVTHQAVVRAAVVAALGAPASAFWRLDVAPLGAVAFTCDGRRWAVRMDAGRNGDKI